LELEGAQWVKYRKDFGYRLLSLDLNIQTELSDEINTFFKVIFIMRKTWMPNKNVTL
jgi:hypothetical protein